MYHRPPLIPAILTLALLIGCGTTSTTPATPAASSPPASLPVASTAPTVQGRIRTSPQPIVGSHIYLFAANNIGYRAPSISLLDSAARGVVTDSSGTYLLTDASGGFNLTGAYTCTPGQQLYILATSGNPGIQNKSNNDSLSLMSALGPCGDNGTLPPSISFIYINEVTTVASVYALAGFMTDPTHVSSAASPGSILGLSNAFAAVNNLVDVTSGKSLAQNLQGNGTMPQAKVNTLANILAPCVNSTGTTSACTALFANAKDGNGSVPSDIVTAVLNIAHNPGANAAALFTLGAANTQYQPALTAAPNDWTLALTFFADNMAGPYFPAIDSTGNLWVPAYASKTLTEFDPTGNILSNQTGFSGGGLNQPFSVAIDPSDNVWVVNFAPVGASTISKFLPNGTPTTSTPYPCGIACFFIAFDTSRNVWVSGSDQVNLLSPSGGSAAQFPNHSYDSGIAVDSANRVWTVGLGQNLYRLASAAITGFAQSVTSTNATNELTPVAIDSSSNIWFVSNKNNAIGKSDGNGNPISPARGYTGGGLNAPSGMAIDGSNRVWVANRNGNSISAFTNAGAPISPSTGYTADSLSGPRGLAIDPSGNVWITNFTYNSITEFLGIATPSATPISPTNHGQRP